MIHPERVRLRRRRKGRAWRRRSAGIWDGDRVGGDVYWNLICIIVKESIQVLNYQVKSYLVTKTKMMDSKNADAELPNRNENATARDSWKTASEKKKEKGHGPSRSRLVPRKKKKTQTKRPTPAAATKTCGHESHENQKGGRGGRAGEENAGRGGVGRTEEGGTSTA